MTQTSPPQGGLSTQPTGAAHTAYAAAIAKAKEPVELSVPTIPPQWVSEKMLWPPRKQALEPTVRKTSALNMPRAYTAAERAKQNVLPNPWANITEKYRECAGPTFPVKWSEVPSPPPANATESPPQGGSDVPAAPKTAPPVCPTPLAPPVRLGGESSSSQAPAISGAMA